MVVSNLGSEVWVSISAAFIALCALGVTIWQGYVTRSHNKVTVRPILSIYVDVADENKIGVRIRNDGFGPAIITEMTIEKSNQKFNLNSMDYLSIFPEINEHFKFGLMNENFALLPSNDAWLMSTDKHKGRPELSDSFVKSLYLTKIHIGYTSIYGDCFTNTQTINFNI